MFMEGRDLCDQFMDKDYLKLLLESSTSDIYSTKAAEEWCEGKQEGSNIMQGWWFGDESCRVSLLMTVLCLWARRVSFSAIEAFFKNLGNPGCFYAWTPQTLPITNIALTTQMFQILSWNSTPISGGATCNKSKRPLPCFWYFPSTFQMQKATPAKYLVTFFQQGLRLVQVFVFTHIFPLGAFASLTKLS